MGFVRCPWYTVAVTITVTVVVIEVILAGA